MAKVNIIGAGLAGLSAGIHLQSNGIDTEIFELAGWAGGMCTAWVRQGYRFDGCIHWMVGTRPGDGFYDLYREVDALAEDTVIYNAPSVHIDAGGVLYEVPLRLEEFKGFLHSLSRQDDASIEELCRDIERMMNTKMPEGMPASFSDMVHIMKQSRGFMALARKYLGMTMQEYSSRFESPAVRSLLLSLMPGEFSAEALFMMLGTRMGGNAGYPMGGAGDVIHRMLARYESLGGRIRLQSRVDEIIVDKGRAAALRTGEEIHRCDAVIAACDAWDTLKKMLGGRYAHPQLDAMLESTPLFEPLAIVSFGLDRKMGIPFSIQYQCPEGFESAPGFAVKGLHLRSFDFDAGAAPGEGSSVMTMFAAPLDYWADLRSGDPAAYRQQKQRLADDVANVLEGRIPGFRDAVVVTDVATPATYVRLTNVYKGSYEGFLPIPSALKTNIKKTVPGVKNLLLCGQWTTAGGGICTAIGSGKEAAHKLKKELGIR